MTRNNTQQMIARMLPKTIRETIHAIKRFEINNEKYPLMELTYDENRIHGRITFNESIRNFFGLLLASRNFGDNHSGEQLELDYNIFVHYYVSDVKMALLKDALINLTNYFEVNQKSSRRIREELFYDFDVFKTKVEEYVKDTKLTGWGELGDTLEDTLDDHEETIHLKVPKLCFPWYAYALCYTHGKFPISANGKKSCIVNGDFLDLKSTRYESEIIKQAQRNFKIFLLSLSRSEDKGSYNRSLNLSLFNETTNLYDIHNIVSLCRKHLPYIKYQSIPLKNRTLTIGDKDYEMKIGFNRNIFKGISHISAINTLGVKTFLIDEFYVERLFSDEPVWDIYNRIFELTKQRILQEVNPNEILEDSNIPEDIRLDFCVYSLLHKEEPYEEHIENIVKYGLPLYSRSTGEIKPPHDEVYSAAYKSFYECRHAGKQGTKLKY